jgi:hypothetical protein
MRMLRICVESCFAAGRTMPRVHPAQAGQQAQWRLSHPAGTHLPPATTMQPVPASGHLSSYASPSLAQRNETTVRRLPGCGGHAGDPRALEPRVIISHTVKRDERETPAGFNPACRIGSCANAAILRSHALFADSSVPAHSITRRPNHPCCANATAAIGWPGGAITDLSSSRPIFIDRHINHQPPCYPG